MNPQDHHRDGGGDERDLPATEDDSAGGSDPASEGAEPSRESEKGSHGLEILSLNDLGEVDVDDDEDGLEEDEVRTILITGASGHIAQKLRAAWAETYDLILIDKLANPNDPEVILADLAVLDEGWITHFHGVDTVIHLAANSDPLASWEEVIGPNLDALANVLHASALAAVERVIFASSNHAMGGYRHLGDMPITIELPPKPDGPYGATKLVGERMGRSLATAFDITFVAIRIGWVQPGRNSPETLPDDWARGMWLSNDDLIQLFDCAVETDLDENQFVLVNGVSNNRGNRWDLASAAELLGFAPQDDAYAEEF